MHIHNTGQLATCICNSDVHLECNKTAVFSFWMCNKGHIGRKKKWSYKHCRICWWNCWKEDKEVVRAVSTEHHTHYQHKRYSVHGYINSTFSGRVAYE